MDTSHYFTPDSIIFSLNGRIIHLHEGEFNPLQSLADFLRSDSIHLTGTKVSCGEGGCGACTVIMSYYSRTNFGQSEEKKVYHDAVNSCLIKLIQVHKTAITTIEFLGTVMKGGDRSIHPIQNSFLKHSATQCGYCSPGFVMSSFSAILNNENDCEKERFDIEDLHHFDGNLCRCTGYRSIIDSLREFSKNPSPSDESISFDQTGLKTYDLKSRIPTVPTFFKDAPRNNICIQYKGETFIIPETINDLLSAKLECIENNCENFTKIIVGSTEISPDISQNRIVSPSQGQVFISTFHMQELCHISIENDDLIIGANTSINEILKFIKVNNLIKNESKTIEEKRFFNELKNRIESFASNQIRNVASIVGNICHGGAATDFSNFLLALKATLVIKDCKTKDTIEKVMDNSFYESYRKISLKPNEVVVEIKLKIPKKNEFISTFKQGRRRDDDICIVSSTIFTSINDETNEIKEIRIAYSGMSACPCRATQLENFLLGKQFTIENIESSFNLIDTTFQLNEKSPGGFPQFRLQIAKSFMIRFYHQTQRDRGLQYDKSATDLIESPAKKEFKINCQNDKNKKENEFDVIGLPIRHSSGAVQVTGESVYVDDIPNTINTLHAAFVGSTIPHGKILNIDFSEALKFPGVVDKITKDDIRGKNYVGDLEMNEPVFAEEEVNFIGQPIALIVAKTDEIARKAAKLVNVTYEELPAILSPQQAIKSNSFFPYNHRIKHGNPDRYFSSSNEEGILILEGEMTTNGQSHFYLETTSVFVVPSDDDNLTVYAATQHPSLMHEDISRVNGLQSHKTNVVVQRIGGAFGGKETRTSVLSNAASVAALKLGVPIKLTLDRKTDMTMQGQRHPLYSKYKIAFDDEGIIHAMNVEFFFDCGWSLDFSGSVCDKAILHSNSAYSIPNFSAVGHLCKTNLITGTAFRAFGTPQSFLTIESAIEKVANYLHKNSEEIRYINLYKFNGSKSIFGLEMNGCTVKECYDLLASDKKFDLKKQRLEAIEFNKNNKYKKIGISIIPMVYPVGFSVFAMNQGFAEVNIFKDGSVKVFHGGCEMGQGLNTKMAQIAASTLSIPIDKVEVRANRTDHVPNASPTSASSGTDINGGAVMNACEILRERLKEIRQVEGRTWEESIQIAYMNQIDLSAKGNFTIKDVFFNWNKYLKNIDNENREDEKPMKFAKCYSYGCSASKVEIDLLTGDHQILRTDIVIDAGNSLNQALDVGQVEGGLLQGIGYFTIEEPIFGRKPNNSNISQKDDSFDLNEWLHPGQMYTNSPSFYKIPTMSDVPHVLNIDFLDKKVQPAGILGSKACSESSVDLALSVPFAIVDTFKFINNDNQFDFPFLHFPLSAPRIKQYVDQINLKKV